MPDETRQQRLQTDSSLEQHLRLLEEGLLQPEVRGSADDVASFLAEDFVEFGASGQVYDKARIIEALAGESPVRRSLADFKVVLLTEDVVLVTYRAIQQRESDEQPSCSLRCSIWQRIDDHWQMVFHQGTPIR